ncbi:RBPJ-interacting and tubulin-associated protein 1 [Centrocercus urophasianus]|uniref:RBPJ-interacting and tubulin-associated protein 1 n=1 Tax=Centrocercus urophasianus TaxID=9002 RepID=UPI001C64DBAA|nr:RBPJ-interacting and tubulin-associated protein 1 [Centrocercus urophasianus]
MAAVSGPAGSPAGRPAGRSSVPRAGSRWRSRSRAPSYCDESLFGSRQPARVLRMGRADVAKLHSLFWSPPPAPRRQPGLPCGPASGPLPAARPPDLAERPVAGSGTARRGRPGVCEHLEGCADAGVRAASPGGCLRSLGRPNASSDRPRLALGRAEAERRELRGSPAAAATPPPRARPKSACGHSAGSCTAGRGCKAKPPWR